MYSSRPYNPFEKELDNIRRAASEGSQTAHTPFDDVADTFLTDFGWQESVVADGETESAVCPSLKSADESNATGHALLSEENLLEPAANADGCASHGGNTEAALDDKPTSEGEEKTDEDTPAVNIEDVPKAKSVANVVRTMEKAPQKRELLKQVVSLAHGRPEFPLDIQHPVIQRLITEPAESLQECIDGPAFAFLMLCACALGRSFNLRLKNDWLVAPNLYGCLLTEPGNGKSPLLDIYFARILELSMKNAKEWQQLNNLYRRQVKVFEKAATKSGKQNEQLSVEPPVAPPNKQFIVDDVTLYALAKLLNDNPRGLAQLNDELSGSFDTFAHETKVRAKYNSAYSCKPWILNRGKEDAYFVPVACLSLFGFIQPSELSKVAQFFRNDGFLDRFLFATLEGSGPDLWNGKSVSPEVMDILKNLTDTLLEFSMAEAPDGSKVPNIVDITPEAHEAYVNWFNKVSLEGWASSYPGRYRKFKEQAAKIILNLHIAESVLNKKSPLLPVSLETTKRALAIADWLKVHQLNVLELISPVQRFHGWTLRQAVLCSFAEAETDIKDAGGKLAFKNLMGMVAQKIYGYDDTRELRKVVKELKLVPAQNCPETCGKRGRGYYVSDEVMSMAKTTLMQVQETMTAASNPEGEAA